MTEPTPQNLLKAPKRQAKTNIKEWILIQTHINTNNTDFTYTNTTDLGQNIFVTGTGGAGNINTSTYDSGHTRYYNKGAVGVALQIFVDDTLCESISGGEGNIVSVADIYKHVRTENHRRKYSCGFLGLKTCWRDNWVQIWEWGHNRRNATHRAEGQTKSFVLNIPPKSTLKVKFVGSSDSEFKGSVSISLLDNPLSIPFKPIDLSGLEGLVEKIPEPLPETPELPEVQEPLPETPELPEVQEPLPETPELPEVQEPLPETPELPEVQEPLPEVEAPQEPQTQEQKLARIQEIKQNALVSEFLSFKGFFETLLSDEVIANQTEPVKLVYGWFREWILNPLNLTRLEDIPASHDFSSDSGANIAMAKWVAKIENINEIYADLQGKGLEVSLNDFKNFIICIMMSVNSQRDSFESERNRYVEIYAMPEIRALIDELEKLEAEVL